MTQPVSTKQLAKVAIKEALPRPLVRKMRQRRFQAREKAKLRDLTPSSYSSERLYTIVTAVYNVEKYLDDFFDSLFNQTLSRDNIYVIAVDDGSTDDSADVVRKWQAAWPEHIRYIRKENSGQSAARNLGLDHVSTEWVTFIDPDDFVSRDYFEIVDRSVSLYPALKMVACNLIFYKEESGGFSDTHPLRTRFVNGDSYYACGDEQMPIQLSMSSAFFRMSEIDRQALRINEEIRPHFEDGHFVGKYLTLLTEGSIGFLKSPHYYYRKRGDASSTIDRSWLTLDKYLNLPKNGYLDLLEFAAGHNNGRAPRNIQNTILYDLSWYFKYLVGHPERSIFEAETDDCQKFFSILNSIFSMVSDEVLFALPGQYMSFDNKFGISTLFKNEEPSFFITYLRQVDTSKKELLIEFFDADTRFFLDGLPAEPSCIKRVDKSLCGTFFYSKYEAWIPFSETDAVLSFRIPDGREVRLSVTGEHFRRSIPINELLTRFKANWEQYKQQGDTWIIMDRDTQADDNGEHFYRYMAINHPDQKCFFALRKDSPHWNRLSKEGFNLLAFGSPEHERELRACSTIISSHADAYVHSYFGDNFLKSKKYVFLQHGITKDDISSWLNGKPISMMCAATPQEFDSLAADGTPYELTGKQVSLTGFARHDHLLNLQSHADKNKKMIFIAPTWRQSLVGPTIGKGNQRDLNPDFSKTEYSQAWESFLKSDQLRRIATRNNCEIVFFPHANILPYVDAGMFEVPSYITIGTSKERSIQEYFSAASLCITDYSSVAFDIAYLGTPCIYYQFDREKAFKGEHIYAKGYFDYAIDGFGPLVETEEDLHRAIGQIAENDFEPSQEYRTRMEETFVRRDGRCCERIYTAIKALS
ncbi:CDP-glycerol glycerophosphotransferase family protein [Adlercreutzia shanghongiae]|uniref:CDP-glycerol glycerophosphotransferase family protein n=1 Tax=Adlercreutzia shanghongiae TaxID=3111773 RepID=A0ABU6J0D0_9ACTN|nr:CDP-glycerol glycerophosphotransferase family protein [Adlercreutzia sp. R22]MEC4295533.1 CDP-glycerol glycerophosphotransferase family protein [Adlercreutzia sp. R22]